MIRITASTINTSSAIFKSAERAAFRNIGHAAASIRRHAIDSIEINKTIVGYITTTTGKGKRKRVTLYEPSDVGEPVHGHVSKNFMRAAIKFDVLPDDAVVGFTESVIGTVMSAHEHGGEYKGETFDERPVMRPALEANLDRFAEMWKGSITK